MGAALINNAMLKWARYRAKVEIDVLTNKYHKYKDWEEGISNPSFKQAQKLASLLKVPFGYLFLNTPPYEVRQTVDLRTIDDINLSEFSLDLKEVIADAIQKQDWFRDYIIDAGAKPLEFASKYSPSSPIEEVAEDISTRLNLSYSTRQDISSKDAMLQYLTEQSEKVGILVIRNGKVGFNTHRSLKVEEFRGFALPDEYAPLIFINSADYRAAQIFTLVHEIAHIWIGIEGVSNYSISQQANRHSEIELRCNAIAAEVLLPTELFLENWRLHSERLAQKYEALANHFKVSSIVVARKALDMELIDKSDFFEFYNILVKRWNASKSKSSGGNFNASFPISNSKRFTKTILYEISKGNLLLRNGARLLNSKASTVFNYGKDRGIL